jgi:ribulose-phosphate 3-epimerase
MRKHTQAFLDCHLMVTHPEQWVDDFASAGASGITFHIEATADPLALIARIKAKGMRAGVALKPKTPADAVFGVAEHADMVLVMTVEPGFGGQSFMADQMAKVAALRARYPSLPIQVDGGLGPANIEQAAAAGATVIVAGTTIFGASDPAAVIAELRAAVVAAKGGVVA